MFVFLVLFGFHVGVIDSAVHARPILGARPGQDGPKFCLFGVPCVFFVCVGFLCFLFSVRFVPQRGARTAQSGGQARPRWLQMIRFVVFFSFFFNYALLRKALVVHLEEPGKVARPGGQWFVYRGLYTQLVRRSDTTNVGVTSTGRTQVLVAE